MEKKDRTKTVAMVLILSMQLREWLSFAVDMGVTHGKFKILAFELLGALNKLLKFLFPGSGKGQNEEANEVYEHSVKISEIIEKFLELDDDKQRRVMSLIDKMKAGN